MPHVTTEQNVRVYNEIMWTLHEYHEKYLIQWIMVHTRREVWRMCGWKIWCDAARLLANRHVTWHYCCALIGRSYWRIAHAQGRLRGSVRVKYLVYLNWLFRVKSHRPARSIHSSIFIVFTAAQILLCTQNKLNLIYIDGRQWLC